MLKEIENIHRPYQLQVYLPSIIKNHSWLSYNITIKLWNIFKTKKLMITIKQNDSLCKIF